MPLPQTAQIASQQAGYLAKCFDQESMDLCDDFQNVDRGTLAYLGGTSALYKVPGIFKTTAKPVLWESRTPFIVLVI